MSGRTVMHSVIFFCCSLFSFELQDVIFVIQSQRNSYHIQRAKQRKTDLLHQAQALNQSPPDVVLLHELSDYKGNWGILPALPRLSSLYCQASSWIVFLEEETDVNLRNLVQVLSKFNVGQEWFLRDEEPTIIHHYAFSEDPSSFIYPDFMFQTWEKDAASFEYYSDITDPYIPTIHLGVPNTERGVAKTSFWTLLGTDLSLEIIRPFTKSPDPSKPHIFSVHLQEPCLPRLRRLLSCYDSSEAVSVGERYGYGLSRDGYSYITGGGGMVFSRTAVQNILAGGCDCCSPDAPDDKVLGMCLTPLGLLVTHSPLFHQARPEDYVKELLARQNPISFHKHWNVNPVVVYHRWLTDADKLDQRRLHVFTKTREEL